MPPDSSSATTAGSLCLLASARNPDDPVSLAIAGAIESAVLRGVIPGKLLRGLIPEEFGELLDALYPGARQRHAVLVPTRTDPDELDGEFGDLLELLLEAAEPAGREIRWLACAISSASLYDNHLWQDLRLPDRKTLSMLLNTHFGRLARRNTANMRWKAFFYKQLCERAGMVCRAPSCGACDDYDLCFGSEEADSRS